MLVTQSCLTLYDPRDCSLPSSSIHGILQARILEWVAIPFFRGSSWPRDWTHISSASCISGRFFTTKPPGKPYKSKLWIQWGVFVCLFVFVFCFVFSIFKRLGEHLHHLVPQHFYDPKKNPQNSHWTVTPHSHPAPGNLWSVSSSVSISLVQFSCSVMSDSLWPHVTKALKASLSITSSQSLLKLMSIKLVMPSNHLILCCPLLLLPSVYLYRLPYSGHFTRFTHTCIFFLSWTNTIPP